MTLLTYSDTPEPSSDLSDLATRYGVHLHHWRDPVPQRHYPTSIRFWLWCSYLLEDPARTEDTYLYLDSDVILTAPLPDQWPAHPMKWLTSDISSYTSASVLPQLIAEQESAIIRQVLHCPTGYLEGTMGGGHNTCSTDRPLTFFARCHTLAESIYTWLTDHNSPALTNYAWMTDMFVLAQVAREYGIELAPDQSMACALATDSRDIIPECQFIHYSGNFTQWDLPLKHDYTDLPPLLSLDLLRAVSHVTGYDYLVAVNEAFTS